MPEDKMKVLRPEKKTPKKKKYIFQHHLELNCLDDDIGKQCSHCYCIWLNSKPPVVLSHKEFDQNLIDNYSKILLHFYITKTKSKLALLCSVLCLCLFFFFVLFCLNEALAVC